MKVPFIIALNSADITNHEIDISTALYGTSSVETLDDTSFQKSCFYGVNRPQNTSLSAVLIYNGLGAWNMGKVGISLWHNPWAVYPLPLNVFEINQYYWEHDSKNMKRLYKKGKDLSAILDINKEYL